MSYATITNILVSYPGFPQTTTSSGYSTTVANLTRSLVRAEGEVNTELGRRYTTPFNPVPPVVVGLTEDLAVYYTMRSKYMKDSHNTNAWILELGDAAKKTLKDLRERKIDLANTAGTILTERYSTDRVYSDTMDYQPTVDVDSVTSWVIDPNRLDSISR